MTRSYITYHFKDHDPILDWVDTAIADSGENFTHIERRSGVTTETLRKWRNRKTRYPQFATIAAVARSLGIDSIPITRRKVK
jgi:DNA-binding phage protein